MSDDFLEYFEPDFTVPEDELCKCGGGHTYLEEYVNEDVQILICTRCGHRSVGYYNRDYIYNVERE